MFTTMTKKRPTFDFWKYEGAEVLPGKVAKRLHDCGYEFSITTNQLNYEDTSTQVERKLTIFETDDKNPLYVVYEGMYLVFSANTPNWASERLDVMYEKQVVEEYEALEV